MSSEPKANYRSDEKIRDRQYLIKDPLSIEGLVNELPKNYENSEFLYLYDRNGEGIPKERYFCCSMKGRHRHLAGYVLESPNGQRFLVGSTCGQKEFGLTFLTKKRAFDHERHRSSLLRKIHKFNKKRFSLAKEIRDLKTNDSIIHYFQIVESLRSSCPFTTAMRLAVRQNNNELFIQKKGRDHVAERNAIKLAEEKIDKLHDEHEKGNISTTNFKSLRGNYISDKNRIKNKKIYTEQYYNVGTLSGGYIFSLDRIRRDKFEEMCRELTNGVINLSEIDTEAYSNKEISSKISFVTHRCRDIVDFVERSESYREFFSDSNIGLLRHFFELSPNLGASITQKGEVWLEEAERALTKPPNAGYPKLHLIREFAGSQV